MRNFWIPWVFCFAMCGAASARATVLHTHTVHAGQRLGSIAKRYNVSIDALCSANGIGRNSPLRVGQKLVIPDKAARAAAGAVASVGASSSEPPTAVKAIRAPTKPQRPTIHVVVSGQRLASIAKRFRVSVDAICTASGLTETARLKPKQKLIIPAEDDPTGDYARNLVDSGAFSVAGKTGLAAVLNSPQGAPNWKRYVKAPRKRGYVTLVGYRRSWKGYAIGPSGRVLPRARTAISSLLNATPEWPEVDTRLVQLMVNLSDKFGGREMRIISGLREKSYVQDSRHHLGRAVDLTVVGVPDAALRDYLLTLDDVGVGYYPNSTFVHLDVREVKAHWVDYSSPGEAPKLAPRTLAAENLRRVEEAAGH